MRAIKRRLMPAVAAMLRHVGLTLAGWQQLLAGWLTALHSFAGRLDSQGSRCSASAGRGGLAPWLSQAAGMNTCDR